MPARRLRILASKLAMILALLLVLEPLVRAESYAASQVSLARSVEQGSQNDPFAGPAQAQPAQAVSSRDPLQSTQQSVDIIVRDSIALLGWRVTALSSQLDESSLKADANLISASGAWHVQALDEKQQSLILDGTLAFTLEAEARTGQGFTIITPASLTGLANGSVSIKGSLSASDVELSLDLSTSVDNQDNVLTQKADLTLGLTRNGQESTIKSSGSAKISIVAYNTQLLSATSTVQRDGRRMDTTETLKVRSFGKGESEVWLESSSVDTASHKAVATTQQHLFQRAAGQNIADYLDRFDLIGPNNSYTLKEPGSISSTPGGDLNYNLVLLDRNGNPFNLQSDNLNPSGRVSGLSSPLPWANSTDYGSIAAGAIGGDSLVADTRAMPADQTSGGGRRPLTPAEKKLLFFALVVGIGLLVISGGAAIGGVVAAAEAGGAGGVAAGIGYSAWAGGIAAGVTSLAGGGAGPLTGGSNADPYFVYPDVRSLSDPVTPSPVQITRVTGGLISTGLTSTASITVTGVNTITTPPDNTPLFNDDPVPFVGGAVPSGANAVGNWVWDPVHPYGAMQSHTQTASDGPQLHYFIHAPAPLRLTQDSNIVQYVYLDPQNPPREIYLQFYTGDGDGEHRVYWGDDIVQTGGSRGTPSLYPMGALPSAGGWARLRVPADKMGLAGSMSGVPSGLRTINGILYGAFGGQTWWGPTTTSNRLVDGAPDSMSVQAPSLLPATTNGAQIAYRLAQPTRLGVTIVDRQGKQVRNLVKDADEQAGYKVLTWDAKDDAGTLVPDASYQVRFEVNGGVVAEHIVTITPLVANIATPGSYSLVRGDQVPVIGEASGDAFNNYTLEYGEGLAPSKWTTIVTSTTPVLLPSSDILRTFNPGNIANWNVGVDEFKPWSQHGLSGLYTLRLRVTGKDGREASDSAPVIVGRLAHTAEGGTITSPDGKATLSIPPLATTKPFSIMALVPLSQVQMDGAWRANLPANASLLGEAYEVFPADETFRRPVTLELPYGGQASPDKVGVMIGDGTPDGWRYIGGKADAQSGMVSVPITDFGGSRAIVAAFSSDNFGPAPVDPAERSDANARLAFTPTLSAPLVISSTAPFAFYSDLNSSPGEWEAFDVYGTRLERIVGPDAGLPTGEAALKVTHLRGGERLVNVRSTPYNAADYPIISFDYRAPSSYAPDLLVHGNGVWWYLQIGGKNAVNTSYFTTLYPPKLVSDDSWHHYQLDLLSLLRSAQPSATSFNIDEMVLGQYQKLAYMQVALMDSGDVGSAYYIANFAALRPTNVANLSFSWTASQGVAPTAYSFALDDKPDTVPPEASQGPSTSATLSLPANAQDGMWYFHLRAQGADGQWGATTHLPVLVDRQPPQLGRPDPPPGGAGSPQIIVVPLVDDGGVDMDTIRVTMGGNTYAYAGSALNGGLRYDPETGSLQILRNLLDGNLPTVTGGQRVDVAVQEATDYAGNKLARPFAWNFTSDQPDVAGEATFQQLTAKGGSSPAISPDGSQVAFVSSRSGDDRIWLMQSNDYSEKAGSAKLLNPNGSGREADPAWAPDGKTLAFVSDAGGSQQVWLVSADGGSARALTRGEGGAASPTWLPDGKALAFVRAGNLWTVAAEGSALQALTSYPEKPIRSVKSQPGGSLLAVGFKLYQETVELYDPTTGELQPFTQGGREQEPAWLNSGTLLYTAPAAEGGLGAVWRADMAASGQAPANSRILEGSGQPGSADMQADVAPAGGSIAMVSTRGGDRNVWVRPGLQVSDLAISPASGTTPGQELKISYTLPSSATVILQVEDAAGKPVRDLRTDANLGKGLQQATWDGTDANGQPLAPGDYVVNLSVKIGSATLSKRATARLLAADDSGTLRVQVNQWAGQPARSSVNLNVSVYQQGIRTTVVARADADSSPRFKLPAGRYDVVVEYNAGRAEARGVAVQRGQEMAQEIDLGLGELDVAPVVAAGHPVTDDAYVQVSRSDDPSGTALLTDYGTTPGFILPPGKYDVSVEYKGLQRKVHGVQVEVGQVSKQEVSMESGIFALTLYSRDGVAAEGGGRLEVRAYSPQDHTQSIGTSYDNPAELFVPAGTYDFRVEYGTNPLREQAGIVSGDIVSWLNGIQVQAGQTITQEYNLKLTPVTIKLEEASGKAAPVGKLTFNIYTKGDNTQQVAHAYTDMAQLELPEGSYDVGADYNGTRLAQEGPAGVIEVKYGQSVDRTIDLALGHVRLEVLDGNGQAVEGLFALANVSGQDRAVYSAFSSDRDHNPLDLVLRSGTLYDLRVQLANGKSYTVEKQQVKEGDVLDLKLKVEDFK
jgi:flagellar hook assembly protein FlgD